MDVGRLSGRKPERHNRGPRGVLGRQGGAQGARRSSKESAGTPRVHARSGASPKTICMSRRRSSRRWPRVARDRSGTGLGQRLVRRGFWPSQQAAPRVEDLPRILLDSASAKSKRKKRHRQKLSKVRADYLDRRWDTPALARGARQWRRPRTLGFRPPRQAAPRTLAPRTVEEEGEEEERGVRTAAVRTRRPAE
ncbi:unnamed protein product, partial [Prorocentrum cordatum]